MVTVTTVSVIPPRPLLMAGEGFDAGHGRRRGIHVSGIDVVSPGDDAAGAITSLAGVVTVALAVPARAAESGDADDDCGCRPRSTSLKPILPVVASTPAGVTASVIAPLGRRW